MSERDPTTPPNISWTIDPPMPHLSPEEMVEFMNGGTKKEVDLAFRDGVVIDYERRLIEGSESDLEIRLVIRHKSATPGYKALEEKA